MKRFLAIFSVLAMMMTLLVPTVSLMAADGESEGDVVQNHINSVEVFTDVKNNSWFKEAVDYVVNNGLMKGMTDTKFAPNESTTRAQLVTVLWRLDGEPAVIADVPFTDLKQAWYKDAVAWAYANGIVNGLTKTEFGPAAYVTREQIATILYRYAEYKNYDIASSKELDFIDAGKVHDYAIAAMEWAYAAELITGSAEGGRLVLSPRSFATRAQIATILMRFCKEVDSMPMGFEENLEVLTALNGDTLNVKIGDLFDSTFTFYAEAYVDGTYVKLVSSEADSVSVSDFSRSETQYGFGDLVTVRYEIGDLSLIFSLTKLDSDASLNGFLLEGQLINGTERDINLISIGIESDEVTLGDGEFYVSSGNNLPSTSISEISESGENAVGEDWFTVYTRKGYCEAGFVCAPTGGAEAYLQYRVNADGDRIGFNVYSEMNSVKIAPGETRVGQSMVVAQGSYYKIMEEVLYSLAETHGKREQQKKLLGWCSWYDKAGDITYESISNTLDAIENLNGEIEFDFIQIDEGYQIARGNWEANEKFPDGLAGLAERIAALGARPGIWMAPVLVYPDAPFYTEHPEAVFKTEDGRLTDCLDVTHPTAKAFIAQMLRDKAEDGFTYFKFDFNFVQANGRTTYDPTKTRLQAKRDTFALYREVLGEDAFIMLNACCLDRATFGYADASRMGTDSSTVSWNEDACTIPRAIYEICGRTVANGIVFTVDPDVTYLTTRKDMTEQRRQVWHSYVGLYGGTVAISDPIEERLGLLDQLRIVQPSEAPQATSVYSCTDKANSRFGFVNKEGGLECGVYVISDLFGLPARNVQTELYPLADIGEKFHVWSFWDNEYLGVKSYDFPVRIKKFNCGVLLRLTPVREDGECVLIGSTLHITCGNGEIDSLERDERGITVNLNAIGALEGSLVFYSEKKISSVTADGCSAELVSRGDNIYEVKLSSRAGEKQSVKLSYE